MTAWQRRARLVIGVSALALAVVVAMQFRNRAPATATTTIQQADSKAISQTDRGRSRRFNLQNEEISIEYEKVLTYADGSSVMHDLKATTKRAGDRVFVITADQGRTAKGETDIECTGNVTITSSGDISVKTDHAVYKEAEGIVRAEGPVTFTQGRTSGSGLGATYDKNRDILTILDQAVVHAPADKAGQGQVDITAGTAEFARLAHVIQFNRRLTMKRPGTTIEAESALAHLSEDEEHLEALDLRGDAKVTGHDSAPGALKSLSGQEMDLKYVANSLQGAAVRGGAVADVFGERGQASRQVSANMLDITLAADGMTPTALTARSAVKLTLPPGKDEPGRTITADAMDGTGKEGQGLTGAHFTGNVELVEKGGEVTRTARAGVLDATMGRGLSSIEDARFSRSVRFEQEGMTATAALARYALAKGTLELTGSEPGSVTPRVVNERMDTVATRIDVALDGPSVHAVGNVQSTLKAAKSGRGSATADGPKIPAMLKSDQDVSVTAGELEYSGKAAQAKYSGNAVLFQGETKIKGASVTLDDKSGNLSATGGVTTTAMLKQRLENGKTDRVLSTGTGKDFKYEEAERKATYTGESRLIGPQGDVRGETITLFLKDTGDEVDRAEARGKVSVLDEKKRKSSGDELKYFSADERYEMVGKPVLIIDQCARSTNGLTLTFFRATDRIILNGTPQNLTRTRSDGSACQ